MTAQWVMPSIDPVFREECLRTIDPRIAERTLVVDNSQRNMGVANSWNLGINAMAARGAEYLVIVSESMRFGPAGGKDVESVLSGDMVWMSCDQLCERVQDTGAGNCRDGYGFHLIAIAKDLLGLVGRFDERFWPAWYEDTDWLYRLNLAARERRIDSWRVGGIDAHLAGTEHSLLLGLVDPVGQLRSREVYQAKWGGWAGHEAFDRPYNNEALDFTYTGLPWQDPYAPRGTR